MATVGPSDIPTNSQVNKTHSPIVYLLVSVRSWLTRDPNTKMPMTEYSSLRKISC